MRNYDTVDATPLFLMTAYSYFNISGDKEFIESILPKIRLAINWLYSYGDTNNDGFIDYRLHPDRKYGGLKTQSWMDSSESVFFEKGDATPSYPIAPVEVQAYAFVALISWSEYFSLSDVHFSEELRKRAEDLKQKFNARFVIKEVNGDISLASAIDGTGRPLISPRSSMAHVLYAIYKKHDGTSKSILDEQFVEPLIRRLFRRDLYVSQAGIRTLSSKSRAFDPFSYHNGSIWPHDTSIFAEGLENFGHAREAAIVRNSLVRAYKHFKTPIELFAYTKGKFLEYGNEKQHACRVQAWSAASLLNAIDSPQIYRETTGLKLPRN
jgi:glycogen debranching enzyme